MNIPKFMQCNQRTVEILSRGSFEDSFIVRDTETKQEFEVEYKQLSPLEQDHAHHTS